MRRDAWAGTLSQGSCQSPVAPSCGLLNHLNSFGGGMFKLNAKFDADSLLCSLGHFECDSHTVHMLTQWHLPLAQWSCHCSCMRIPVHSSWLPGYTDVSQTVLVILATAGLFLDRPWMSRNTTVKPSGVSPYYGLCFGNWILELEYLCTEWNWCCSED